MYIPKIYTQDNPEEILEFIKEHSFCTLINQTNGKLCATHIPLLLEKDEDKTILHGHISKLNTQSVGFEQNDTVLVLFMGAHSYISPSWYDHENVPTWNYLAVHVYGKITILTETQAIESLQKMMNYYEAKTNSAIRFENLSAKTKQEAQGVIAFKIDIEEIQAVKKLSQNRDDKNYNHIITKLEQSENANAQIIAKEMIKSRKL